jgi:APA family basic amino acid/polyamine antiporter
MNKKRIISLLCFVGFGIVKIQPDFFASETFFTGGFSGVYTTVALLFFAVGGAYIITDFAPMIKNASKIMVKVIFIVTIGICFIYMLLGIVASGAVPLEDAAYETLAVSAKEIFPNNFLYAFFIIGGALGALITTLNSSFLWYSSSVINACNEGWFPVSWAKKNKNDVPYILMTIFYLFGLIPTVFGISLTVLSKIAVGMTILCILIPMAGILNLPKKYPKEWADSKYAKKYPMWRIRSMVIITYLIMSTQVYSLFSGNPLIANVLIILYILLVGIYLFVKYKKRTALCEKSQNHNA